MASTLPAPNALAQLTRLYGTDTINQKVQRCLLLQAKLWELKNDASQTDYTTNHRQLRIDAKAATIGMTSDQLYAAQIGEAWAIATAIAGAPNTLNAQILSLGQLVNQPDEDLDRMDLLIEYLLQQATGD